MRPTSIETERLTAEDYRALPDTGRRYQLVDGALYMAPAPSAFHQEIIWNLSQVLGGYLHQHPVGKVYLSPYDVYLSENDVVQPDLTFIAESRLHLRKDDGLHGAPDLVIEILSPSTALLDAKGKRTIYARHGVKELWLVDPTLRQIHLYDFARDAAKAGRILDDDESFGSTLLPGLTIAAADVFRR